MKSIGKAAMMVLLTLWLMSPALPVTAMDVEDAPESVTLDYLAELYEGVEFDHLMHTDLFSCASCHHHTTGEGEISDSCAKCHAHAEPSDDVSCSGCHEEKQSEQARTTKIKSTLYHIDKPSLKGALHLQCVGCHQSEDGPTGCLDCHDFTPAGKKLFFVEE